MKPIVIPQQDVNSQHALLREWLVSEGETVTSRQAVATVETSKASYDVFAPTDGTVVQIVKVGEEVPFQVPIGGIAEERESVEDVKEALREIDVTPTPENDGKATKKAAALAKELGVDLSTIEKRGIIREDDVRVAAGKGGKESLGRASGFLSSDEYPPGLVRLLVVGAGNGLAQVADIVSRTAQHRIIGCVDDNTALHNKRPFDTPCLGGTDQVSRLYQEGSYDQLIIAISSHVGVRQELFERFHQQQIPFANIIDPSAQCNRYLSLGTGNVICSLVHIGAYTSLGDNNFISAHCSIDHHNIWGSHNTLGPGCHFSGSTKIGSGIKFGTGIFAQNRIAIGDRAIIASGAILTHSVPESHTVKTELRHTIVPNHR